jgi:hypothetical protein
MLYTLYIVNKAGGLIFHRVRRAAGLPARLPPPATRRPPS